MKKALLLLAMTLLGWGEPLTLTPKALIERPRPQECQLSPDGQWLAVQLGRVDWKKNKVVSELQLYRVGHAEPAVRLPQASSPRWSADSTQLLCNRWGHLWVSSTRSWKWRQLTKDDAEEAVWAPDGKHIAYFGEAGPAAVAGGDSGRLYDDLFLRRWNHYYDGRRRHIFVTDLKGKRRDVTPGDRDAGPTSNTFSSGDNMVFSADGGSIFFSAPPVRGQASSTNYDVFRVELSSLHCENLTAANLAADLGPRLDGNRLLIMSYQRPGYESDFGTIKSCPVTASGELAGEWKAEETADGLGEWTPSRQGLLCTRSEKGRERGYVGQKALNHLGSLHSLSVGGGSWAGIESGLSVPPQVVVGKVDADTVTRLGERPNWQLGQVESLEVPVEGPTPMQMWLVKPPNYRSDRRWPLVVLVHGGPQGGWGDAWSLRWNPQVWAALGYMVAMPNPRGSSGRGRAFQEEVSRDWGGLAYRDLMTAVDSLVARPDVDGERMAAAGASYGGYMVNWFSVNTGRFKALVTHDGVWNLESMYGTTDELWFADWEFGGFPWGAQRPADFDKFSPHKFAERLGQFKTPHMVIHNDLDYRCPIDQGLQLFTALQRQGVESRFLNFPDEGHWVSKPANSLRWYTEVFHFVTRYCKRNP